MKSTFNWGIIGPGRIAHKFAKGLAEVPEANLIAIASRDHHRATAFAAQYGAPKAYSSYQALVEDPEIDIVYVATPHPFHCEQAIRCLEHGKAVLCEKPIAMNSEELARMIDAAKAANRFLMEGLWTRFHPNIIRTKELIDQGRIGRVNFLRADFGFITEFDPTSRLYDMKLGGGSLLDIGIYPLFLAQYLFGAPLEIQSMAELSPTGSDVYCNIQLRYAEQKMASLHSSVITDTKVEAEIYGSDARILIHNLWFTPGNLSIHHRNEHLETIEMPEGHFFVAEIQAVTRCLQQGLLECPEWSHADSILLTQTMDTIRQQCGIEYEKGSKFRV